MAYEGFVDMKYRPKNDVVCTFRLEPASAEAMNAVAGESSIGTWTEVKTMNSRIKKMGATVFSKSGNVIKVAYPAELFEPGNMPQILSSVAGNIFGMKIVRNLRLEDIELGRLERSFPGPRYGIAGIRKLLGIRGRPLVGTIIKPKLGLREHEHATVAYRAWSGGIDIVKDDENLTSQSFNRFEKRVTNTLKMLKKAERETGENKAYMPNVTAECDEMVRRAHFVKDNGGTYAMVDILTVGWSGLQSLRNADTGLVLHAHRAMHAAFTRNPRHGISMMVIGKVAKAIGIDQLHVGTAVGKMSEEKKNVIAIAKAIRPVFPVCSGGLHPGMVPELVRMLGNDVIIQSGGGIHGHPDGTRAGAAAMRQAVDAAASGKDLSIYAKTHEELRKAITKWGYLK